MNLTTVEPVLEVRNLSVGVQVGKATHTLLDSVNLTLRPGETFALVGESGSGKTMTALAIIGLLPQNARILSGEILFEGKDLVALPSGEKRILRRSKIATVFQDPMNFLNPIMTIGEQLIEVVPSNVTSKEEKVKTLLVSLEKAGFREPKAVIHKYPHELSGGMCQRAMLAMALVRSPRLIIADEITTGIDVTTQAALLDHLKHLKETLDLSILMITHDLGVVANSCDRMAVMYAGTVFETGDVMRVLKDPIHPYTKALLNTIPRIGSRGLEQIPGSVPTITSLPGGCRFHPRCGYAIEACRTIRPPRITADHDREVECHVFPIGDLHAN